MSERGPGDLRFLPAGDPRLAMPTTCRGCGYNLAGLRDQVCPECGQAVQCDAFRWERATDHREGIAAAWWHIATAVAVVFVVAGLILQAPAGGRPGQELADVSPMVPYVLAFFFGTISGVAAALAGTAAARRRRGLLTLGLLVLCPIVIVVWTLLLTQVL